MVFPCLTTRLSCCCSCAFSSGIVWSVCSVLRAGFSAIVSALGGPWRAHWWLREAQGGSKGRALGGPGRILAVPRTAQGGQCYYFVPPAISPLTRSFTNCRIFSQSGMQNHFFKVHTIAFNDLWNISWYNYKLSYHKGPSQVINMFFCFCHHHAILSLLIFSSHHFF